MAQTESLPYRATNARSGLGVVASGPVPVKWSKDRQIKELAILWATVVLNEPSMDAGSAEGMFARSLQRILEHISANATDQPFIDITNKALHIVAHFLTHTVNLIWE